MAKYEKFVASISLIAKDVKTDFVVTGSRVPESPKAIAEYIGQLVVEKLAPVMDMDLQAKQAEKIVALEKEIAALKMPAAKVEPLAEVKPIKKKSQLTE